MLNNRAGEGVAMPGDRQSDDDASDTAASEPESVFLSYSSADLAVARRLRDALDQQGCSVWMAPDSIQGTDSWVNQILAALNGCPNTVVLISTASMSSQHVAREVGLSLDAGKPVIPLRITADPLTGPLAYLLHLSQWIDAFDGPIERYAQPLITRLANSSRAAPGTDPSAARQSIPPVFARRRRRMRWLVATGLAVAAAATAVTLALVGGTSPSGSAAQSGPGGTNGSSPATSSGVDAALKAVPSHVTGLSQLGAVMSQVARADGLPPGRPVELQRRAMPSGSISLEAPGYWRQGSTTPWLNHDNKRVGDIVFADVDDSRFYGRLESSGIGVGAAVPARTDEHNVDDAYHPTIFENHGCIDSAITSVAGPFRGETRVWSGCEMPGVTLVGYFTYRGASVDVALGVTTRSEAAAASRILASITLRLDKIGPAASSSSGAGQGEP